MLACERRCSAILKDLLKMVSGCRDGGFVSPRLRIIGELSVAPVDVLYVQPQVLHGSPCDPEPLIRALAPMGRMHTSTGCTDRPRATASCRTRRVCAGSRGGASSAWGAGMIAWILMTPSTINQSGAGADSMADFSWER